MVEAARLLPYQSFCNSTPTPPAPGPVVGTHPQEANALVRAQRFTPWIVNGRPASVLIHTSLAIAPPERFGPSHSFPTVVDPATVSVGLERRGCEGRCPAYSVNLAADGTVTYKGFAYVAVPGQRHAHVPAATVTQLLDRFRQANFLSALPVYSGAFDGGYNVLKLSVDGTSYQIVNESGSSVGLPTAIYALERAVDEATDSAGWVTSGSTMAPILTSAPSRLKAKLYRRTLPSILFDAPSCRANRRWCAMPWNSALDPTSGSPDLIYRFCTPSLMSVPLTLARKSFVFCWMPARIRMHVAQSATRLWKRRAIRKSFASF